MPVEPETKPAIVLAGGSGFLGRGLTPMLLDRGYAVHVLSRSSAPDDLAPDVHWHEWDGKTLGDWSACLDGAAGLINLVGRTVDCRKTPANVQEIHDSRVNSCWVLGEACRKVNSPPPVWLQSATAHIVGDPVPLDTLCDESTPPGPMHEMAPRVGVAWEQAFDEAKLPEQRGVKCRISFVLGHGGGAFATLARLTKLGLGGTVGHGKQYISWVHLHDLNRLWLDALTDPAYAGVYIVTAPHPVTNRRFMQAMRQTFRRPWSPPAPAIGVRLASRFILNTDPELALLGRRCVPTRLQRQGFTFDYPDIDSALAELA
jgi:uncharacterized protein (TIGR01777 family)